MLMYKHFIKRLIDIILSLVGIMLLAFPMLIISIAIKKDDLGPILFRQKRVGKNKKYFILYKFRSMKLSTPHDVPKHLLRNPEQYMLGIGGLLRRFSLDELPQLFNILKGDMSIIGPRPALWNQYDLIDERDKYDANSIRPGLTGWAQVNGRDEIDLFLKARYDGEYVNKLGFGIDLKCFILTFGKVLKHDDVYEGYK